MSALLCVPETGDGGNKEEGGVGVTAAAGVAGLLDVEDVTDTIDGCC